MRELILGVLPSDGTLKDPSFGQEARGAARRTWVAATPPSVTVRFVVTPKMRRQLAQLRRRKLARAEELDSGDTVALPSPNSSCKCAATVHRWFTHALATWPNAEWYGKTEDDIYVQSRVLHWELARLPRDPMVWYGLMAWTGTGDAEHPNTGCWGGQFEDDVTHGPKITQQLLGKERGCPESVVLTPSPMHEVDVRGRGLAAALVACAYPAEWLASFRRRARRCGNDCAGVQGHWVAKCVRERVKLAHVRAAAPRRRAASRRHPRRPRRIAPPLRLSEPPPVERAGPHTGDVDQGALARARQRLASLCAAEQPLGGARHEPGRQEAPPRPRRRVGRRARRDGTHRRLRLPRPPVRVRAAPRRGRAAAGAAAQPGGGGVVRGRVPVGRLPPAARAVGRVAQLARECTQLVRECAKLVEKGGVNGIANQHLSHNNRTPISNVYYI